MTATLETAMARVAPATALSDFDAELVLPEDPRWLALTRRVRSDVYHRPAYLRACAEAEVGMLCVALVGAEGAIAGIPLFVRALPNGQAGFDASSPYGYPCLIGDATTSAQWRAVWEKLRVLLADNGIVAAFLRLHPLLTDEACLEGAGDIAHLVEHGRCVYLQLDQSEEALWSETRSRFRSNINSLKREGWRFVADDWSLLPAFTRIYEATMERTGASRFYFFPPAYFHGLREGLGRDAILHAVMDPAGKPASVALFLSHRGLVQYHLGGTAPEHLAAAPAKLLFHEARLWHRRQGDETLHLGGGFGGQDDSLFRFKQGFSKRSAAFLTARLIVDQDKYRALSTEWERRSGREAPGPEGFFPAYRASTT